MSFTHRDRALAAALFPPMLALAGCASAPPEHFYSLGGGEPAMDAPAVPAPPYFIELQTVSVPQQVARSQLVVEQGDGRLALLEQQRWSAPLAAELSQALSLAVSARLGALDVQRTPTPAQATVYRVSTDVRRFVSAPGRYALIDAVWSVRRVGGGPVLTCASAPRVPVASGYDALVAGHRRAVQQLADDIAAAVRRLAGGAAGC